ncbi:hypothetical protein K1T71_002453 [Dendrolimus kikuchii]|uniref:Uncharacterized protein n=1 Tax=Dendrolimus kikuchii TaxID=765133 RepID=A0ACC1DD25_9NEOP|nr:hypothetical protein K1T71_002453 [Dendrolimus kikuchii]
MFQLKNIGMKQKRLTICKTYGVNVKNMLQSMTETSLHLDDYKRNNKPKKQGVRDVLDQLRMTTKAPGRPRILRTGSVGRPKKIYQTREVERSVTSTDANEVEDFAGSTEITLKNALKSNDKPDWEEAILSEIRSLVQKALKRSEFPRACDDTPYLSETPLNNVAVSFGKLGRFARARAFVIVILSSSFTYDVPRTSIEF